MSHGIPKVIHYCWFGKNPKPELIQKCIESWQMYCPEYQIIEWNEDNWDIHMYPYTEEAYSELYLLIDVIVITIFIIIVASIFISFVLEICIYFSAYAFRQ